MIPEQLYQQLLPELKKLNRIRIPYLFFKNLGATCMILILLSFIYLIFVYLFFSLQPIEQLTMNIGKWTMWFNRNNSHRISFSKILFFTGSLSMLFTGIFFGILSNIQQRIFNSITGSLSIGLRVIKKIISNQQILNTGFFNEQNNAPLTTLSKGTIYGEINELNFELWDVSVITNKYYRLMMIPILGILFSTFYLFISYFKIFFKNDLYDQGFKGLIIKLEFPKSLSGRTLVLQNSWEQKFSFANRTLQTFNNEEKNVVDLTDTNFNKKFTVYSSDQVEARYILTPTFMEKISEWQEELKRPLFLSFNEQCLYMAIIDHEGIFEIPLSRSALDPANIEKPFNDLKIFSKMIEEFNTDKKIWYKPHLT